MIRQIPAILLALCISTGVSSGQTTRSAEISFTPAELKADLRYLKQKLESHHPGLYLYTPKSRINEVFDSLENSISKPLTETAFYKHIAILSSIIKDGHTIILPGAKTTNYHNQNSRFLPYHFTIADDKLYIDMLFTSDHTIPVGAEITAINDMPAAAIIQQLMERQVRDGNNLTYPAWILNNYFRQYYSFNFGHPDTFAISFKQQGQLKDATISALSKDSIYYYRQLAYPSRSFSNQPNEGIKLKIDTVKKYAVLIIKDFHNDVLKKEFRQHFGKTIAAYFDELYSSRTENLVLDLRNNQGGDIENGVILLSYLLDKPFTVVREYFCVEDQQLQPCNGPSLGLHNVKSNNFKGKLYVLINGGSFSNSGIVSSCLQANNRAIFIGQETGGNPNVIAGFTEDTDLPNTKIQIQLPTRLFVMTGKQNNPGQGLIPTYLVVPTLADIIEGRDPELAFAISLISK